MSLIPVIMCGGAGTRLWPTSTGARPKQFTPLVDRRSTFDETLRRAAAVAPGERMLIIAGARHQDLIASALKDAAVEADVLLEPEGRESAPAMAAAAVFLARSDPDALMVVLSSDHHIQDGEGFNRAVATAAVGARAGNIVTLGVRPTEASTAYGYILPSAERGDVRRVVSFVEKPDTPRASGYVAAGYLWNSGMFLVTARSLLAELAKHAPDVLRHARRAVEQSRPAAGAIRLSDAFAEAPSISIDYAVMEKTDRAAVVTADFDWVDIGAWDAVFGASARDEDDNAVSAGALVADSTRVLVRADPGVQVAVVGMRDVAVVAEGGSVLVCALDHSQAVKGIVGRLAAKPPSTFPNLETASSWYDRWMRVSALPLWFALGADHEGGGFHEALTVDGQPTDQPRRLRVQARQIYAYASAGLQGWQGPWRQAAAHGLKHLRRYYLRPDGLYRSSVNSAGQPVCEDALIYDEAFVLLAFAVLHEADPSVPDLPAQAEALWKSLQSRRTARGGYLEVGARPYQANAHMHLFEAALAWTSLYPLTWGAVADELGAMALRHFFDARLGVVHEVFDERWRPARGEIGRIIEPGHQFEWAWLLDRWTKLRGDRGASEIASRLFAAGGRGVDPRRGVAVNELLDDFAPIDPKARLWPQTERIRASIVFGDRAGVLSALNALRGYLLTPIPGVWRDRMFSDGTFAEEPSPATSLYHLVGAWRSLADEAEAGSRGARGPMISSATPLNPPEREASEGVTVAIRS
jgi:mannose-1-phosphate guanylyltransferase/mannose-6-phosphate isomerase